MFIVIEGLDGVGKTTAAQMLAKSLNGEFFPWLHAPYNNAMPHIWGDERISEASKHIAFLAAFKHMSDVVSDFSYHEKIIVADRYYFCSLAMHPPLSALRQEPPLKLDYAALRLKKPDFAFYLDLNEQSRRHRLASRGEPLSPVEKILEENTDFCRQVRSNYETLVADGFLRAIPIDDLSREDVVQVLRIQTGC